MEILTQFGLNIALALIGTAIFTLWSVRAKLREFNLGIFFKDNKAFWIWCTIFQVVFAGLVALSPESAGAFKTLIGIDFSEPFAFVTSGWMLAIAANAAVKEKIGRKRDD